MGRFDIDSETRPKRSYPTTYDEFITNRTVTVWLDHSQPSKLQPFRCTVCGNIVFEHTGEVVMMVSGHYVTITETADQPTKIVQCSGTYLKRYENEDVRRRNCHARYQVC